jgi:SAM-dependent methyltransferase
MSKTIDQGKEEVSKLCRYFATNRQAFLAPGVKEAHVRQSLIDPLFESLGWDVRNTSMVAPQYREVVPEDSLDVEGQQKAPDYVFRVGASPKFYAEAKKCDANIDTDPRWAYQLRRYGWSAKVALSILTDFAELSVYDCTLRPHPGDKASHARILHFGFEEYPDRWRELWDVFSREAIWSGAFDQYAASKRKRGTSEVDVEFLREIEAWREALARNMALRNRDLSPDDLNAAVQLSIDRVVFLRMGEDRGIEPYEQLLKLCERPDIYARFTRELCRKADEKYNSGLFHFQKEPGVSDRPDRVTPRLTVDDKVFKPILQSLYFAHGSPYHFGVMPVEILGTVYERFLGKVVRLTAGHQAKVEEKPEVRKAGGVYYTPAYIVEYIVRHTAGKKIVGKSPAQLAGGKGKPPFRVLDMACGSGSFLLGAYQCFLDYCLKWYIEHKPESFKRAVYRDPRGGEWRLTIEEKSRILTTHLFGVDIDPQAVEVSKLSLLLKALEDENDATLSMQRKLFYLERALPNLADNIKCGNSLIGPDYFTGILFPDADEIRRVNPFDWNKELPDAMKAGFDCVIGNPPYVFTRETIKPSDRRYYSERYALSWEKQNTYMLFMERLLGLLKPMGLGGFIVPNSWLTIESAKLLRRSYLKRLRRVVDLNFPAFQGVSMEPCVFVADGSDIKEPVELVRIYAPEQLAPAACHLVERAQLQKHNSVVFYGSGKVGELIERIIAGSKPLGALFDVRTGLQAYERGKGNPPQTPADVEEHVFDRHRRESKESVRYLEGKDVQRYAVEWSGLWMQYGPWLSQPREIGIFTRPRILLREITGAEPYCLKFAYLEQQFLNNKSILNVLDPEDDCARLKTLIGILNSRLMSFFYKQHAVKSGRKIFPKVVVKDLGRFPIPGAFTKQDRMVTLVEPMLALHKQLAGAKSVAQKAILQRQVDATDAKIDRLVYDLYRLTDEEIAVVESARECANE